MGGTAALGLLICTGRLGPGDRCGGNDDCHSEMRGSGSTASSLVACASGVRERLIELLAGEPVAVLDRPLVLALAVDPAVAQSCFETR